MSRNFLVLIFMSILSSLYAQGEDRYMVFYTDKTGTTFSVDQPLEFLSQKAINRRINQNIALNVQDFPPNAGYVSGIRNTGAKVMYTSRWFNASLVEATASQLTAIQQLSFVDHTEFVAPGKTGTGGRLSGVSRISAETSAPATYKQTSMIGLDAMHADGLEGQGMTIGVFDSGFPGVTTNPAYADIMLEDRIKDFYNFALGDPNVFMGNDHGARVFSVLGAELDNYKGAAPKANYLLYSTEYASTEYRVEEYYWALAAERADSAGVDIISSSVGYSEFEDITMDYSYSDLDGETAVISRAAEFAFQRGIVVVNAAGNRYPDSDWSRITPPADAVHVLAVGSVDENRARAFSSLLGPSADGRIKPDVMAMGVNASVVLPNGSVSTNTGTSLSCPLIAGFVACVWQAHPELTAIEVVDLIRKAGSQYFNPDVELGYGIPTYQAVRNMFEFPGGTGILVYPNPMQNDIVKLAFTPTDGTEISYQVFSIMGQPIHEETYTSNWHLNPFEVNFSGQPSGVYMIKVHHGATTKTFRVVKP